MSSDTIAAIATAPGRAGVAVIRVSGPDAFAVAARLTGREAAPGRIVHSKVFDGDGRLLDDCVVLAFAMPHSYTGEDVVEFQCHGGSVTPRRILEACFAAGARLARRGEFTERAFLSGKLDYDQAEAVLDLIDAKTTRAADAALMGMAGSRKQKLRDLYDLALSLSTDIEHALDFEEGELTPDFFTSLNSRLAELRDEMEASIRNLREGKLLRDGALVVLAGAPNAGKSSLMNALLEENRAIVSDTPGTTRDSIGEWMEIAGFPVRLIDTAGLRETDDAIEFEGVRRAENLVAEADVVLALDDSVAANSAKVIRIRAKCDLGKGEGLNVSAKTGEGIAELKAMIAARLETLDFKSTEPDVSPLLAAQRLLPENCDDLVLAGNALARVAGNLGELVGATYASDLIDRLFSRFCVGK